MSAHTTRYTYSYSYVPYYMRDVGDLDELDSLSDFDDMESVSDDIMTDPSGADAEDVSTVSAWTATGTATINQQDLARIDRLDQELELTNNAYRVSTSTTSTSWMFDDDNVSLPDTDTDTTRTRTRTLHRFDFDQYDQHRSALKTKTKSK